MFTSLTELANKVNTYAARTSIGSDTMSIAIHGPNNRHTGFRLFIKIPLQLLKEARYLPGDRVDLFVDPDDRTGLISRVPDGRWKISLSLKTAASVYLTLYDTMPFVKQIVKAQPVEKVSIRQEGILFVFPAGVLFE